MQVNSTVRSAAGLAAGGGASILMPMLVRLGDDPTHAQSARRQQQQDDDDRRREDDAQRASQTAALGAPALAAGVIQSERRMDPSSRAFQRQQTAIDGRERSARQSQQFRDALADAANREGPHTASEPVKAPQPGVASDASPPADAISQQKQDGPENAAQPGHSRSSLSRAAAAGDPGRPAATGSFASSPPSPDTATSGNRGDASAAALAIGASPSSSSPALAQQTATGAAATATAAAAIGVVQSSGASGPISGGVGDSSAATVASVSQGGGSGGAQPGENGAFAAALLAAKSNDQSHKSTAATISRAAAQDGKDDANVEQIVRVISSRLSEKHSKATLRLDPPSLGSIRLHMDLREQTLLLRIDSESALAQRVLSEQIDSLRQALEASGIRLESVEFRAIEPPPETDAGYSQQPSAGQANQDGSAEANPQSGHGSHAQGRDSHTAAPIDGEPRGPMQQPAAESLVNILA